MASRVGLVGPNGSGKTTLLRALCGVDARGPISGTLTSTSPARYLEQEVDPAMSLAALFGVEDRLADLDLACAGAPTIGPFEAVDWHLRERLSAQLSRFDLDVKGGFSRPMGSLSGGQRLRAALAALFFDVPDIICMDEPTNNLDAAGRGLLKQHLRDFRGLALIASHDRDLLGEMDRLLVLAPDGSGQLMEGGWDAYVTARDAQRDQAAAQVNRANRAQWAATRARVEAEKRRAGRARTGKAARADGSMPKILADKLKNAAQAAQGQAARLDRRREDTARADHEAALRALEVVTPLDFHLPERVVHAGARVLSVCDLMWQAGAEHLGPLSFDIVGPMRLHLTGANGCGKSQLLKYLTGAHVPMGGRIERHLPVAYLAQDVLAQDVLGQDAHAQKNGQGRLIDVATAQSPQSSDHARHEMLAAVGFRGQRMHEALAHLSGGERLRLGLAIALLRAPQAGLLVLDEPSNHLDVQAIEALESALRGWRAALICVTHDPRFAAAIGFTHRLEIGAGDACNAAVIIHRYSKSAQLLSTVVEHSRCAQ